jgi:hypothetical protein
MRAFRVFERASRVSARAGAVAARAPGAARTTFAEEPATRADGAARAAGALFAAGLSATRFCSGAARADTWVGVSTIVAAQLSTNSRSGTRLGILESPSPGNLTDKSLPALDGPRQCSKNALQK